MKGKLPALLPRIVSPPVSFSLKELSKNYLSQEHSSEQLALAKHYLSKGSPNAVINDGKYPAHVGSDGDMCPPSLSCASELRLNLLTPSPEAIEMLSTNHSTEAIDLNSSSDESDEVYSLPPTPSISDDSDDIVLLTCLPEVKSVTTVSIVPEELIVYLCEWRGCVLRWETRETLHRHIVTSHSQSSDLLDCMTCQWIGCAMFGKKSRTAVLFDRHIQSHTSALMYPCIMDNCTMRFDSEKTLEKHCSSHLRKEQNEREGTRSPKKRRCFYKPVQSKPYHKLVPDAVFNDHTMGVIQSKVLTLHYLTSGTNSVSFPSESVGSRMDSITGFQSLIRAKHHSILTRWSMSPNAKVTHTLSHCPDDALQYLGLLWKQKRSRKRRLKVQEMLD